MFDLSNLNDYEFEILSKDIMQKLLGQDLFIFSRGVDAGVDICDREKNPTIVIQAKHYVNSTYSQLKGSLKKEVKKVYQHHPKKYFVCTSQSLTRKNKLEIADLFGEFMPDISYIKDKNDINSFLEDEENKDIVVRNYKLWLCASNVLSLVNNQDVFIDCAELMLDIEAQIKLFVETQAYQDAIDRLHQNNIIIIIGAPGVGKSTISKMLLLYYADKGYKVRYVTNNNISEIKRSVSLAPNKKEIILLDDFLGQHYLNLKDSQPNELKTLISFVTRSKNKKLILNSRITILNEATQSYLTFKEIMVRYERNKYLLNLDEMSSLEKAKILYNHLYFNRVPQEYLSQIKQNRGYLKIVNHKNYNPRIIEYVTQEHNYRTVPSEDYLQYFMAKLDNPEDVWKDEFRNRLGTSDRIFMNTLYSLSDTTIDSNILEHAFNARIMREANCDTSVNQYKESANRLLNSLIKNVDDRGIAKISAINPSVNDYLFSEIIENPNEQIAIIDNALFYEQVFRVLKSDAAKLHYKNRLHFFDYLEMDTLFNNAFFYFLKSIVELNILDATLKNKTRTSLEHAHEKIRYQDREDYGNILKNLYLGEYCKFYKLYNIFLSSAKMSHILNPLTLNDANTLINAVINDYDISDNEELMAVFKSQLIDKISDCVRDELSDELQDIVSREVSRADPYDIEGFMSDRSTVLENSVWSEVEDLAYEKIKDYISNVNSEIDITDSEFDVDDMRFYLDISDSITSAIKADYDDYDDDRRYSHYQSDNSLIIKMFER